MSLHTARQTSQRKIPKEWLRMARPGSGTGNSTNSGVGTGRADNSNSATGSNSEALKEKLQEDFLSCKICLEPFRRPKALPCLHTFCEDCLTDYVRQNPGDQSGYFPCPMCRSDTHIPDGGVTDFKDNFVLLSLSQMLEEDNSAFLHHPTINATSPCSSNSNLHAVLPSLSHGPPSPREKKLRSYDWYFGKVSRNASEEWLLQTGCPKGMFLIRQGEATPDTYTLSVRDCDDLRGYLVKHYKIHMRRSGENHEHYFITQRRTFVSLSELVNHYSDCADGLCCKLTQVCAKPRSLVWAMDRGQADAWETSRDHVKLVTRLGSGQFAEVWAGKLTDTRQVAIKIQRKEAVSMTAFLDEGRILKTLQHDHIVRLLAVCSDKEPVYLVMEYMVKGRLSQYLREGQGRLLHTQHLLWMATQIANGMAYIEKERFVHRNLGARNILVGEQHRVKIAGFGMTKVIDDPDFNFRKGLKMAIKWMAPEVLLYNKYSTKSDVWSFGIVIIELFTYGKEPYDGMPSKQAFEKVQNGYRIPRPDKCPSQVYQATLQCWNTNPPARPSFDYLYTFLHDSRP